MLLAVLFFAFFTSNTDRVVVVVDSGIVGDVLDEVLLFFVQEVHRIKIDDPWGDR